jgi:hypothetical protein
MPIPLDKKTIELLLSHPGYGIGNTYPQKVEIIFIGNESGTAGRTTEEYIYRLLNPALDQQTSHSPSPQRRSPMLQFMNRIRLYSIEPNFKWLLPKKDLSQIDYDRILNEPCLSSSPACETNTHLIDIRPLPRPTEADALNYQGLDSRLYLKAFNTFTPDKNNPYFEWVVHRKQILIDTINQFSNTKFIVAAGKVDMKMSFLQSLFPEISFKKNIGDSGQIFFTATINRNNREILICVCNFLSHQNGIGFKGLKDLVRLLFNTK